MSKDSTSSGPSPSLDREFAAKVESARVNPKNVGELENADAVGTVGSPDCGDMLRMWIKFKEENGKKVIDRATFQTFGCQTAIAVASMATEMIAGKTASEALAMSGAELAAPLGPLPPMKIHCAQLVEGALRDALQSKDAPDSAKREKAVAVSKANRAPTLFDQLSGSSSSVPLSNEAEKAAAAGESGAKKVKIVFLPTDSKPD